MQKQLSGASNHPATARRGMTSTLADRLRLARVRVGTSAIHHLGVFAVAEIKQGTRILAYRGEKITKAESARRVAQGNAYIFAFNDRYDIDGKVLRHPARYINHSCDPNCHTIANLRTIWIVALRHIAQGEELTYNYGYGPEEYEDYRCHCGAANCCGYMLDPRHWHVIKPQTESYSSSVPSWKVTL